MKQSFTRIKRKAIKTQIRKRIKRRKGIRKKSQRQLVIDKIDRLLLKELIQERGQRCEFSGGTQLLGLFHILPKGLYPNIRFHKQNLLIVGWYSGHFQWHHNYHYAKNIIEPKIKQLRGDNYEIMLKKLNAIAPKLSMFQIQLIHRGYSQKEE